MPESPPGGQANRHPCQVPTSKRYEQPKVLDLSGLPLGPTFNKARSILLLGELYFLILSEARPSL